MAVLPVGAVTSAFSPASISSVSAVGATPAAGSGFGEMLTKGLEGVTSAQDTASTLSGQVATGQLTDISDFTTAAAKASLGVSLTAAVRNRAVEAYQEIMRMQV